MEKSNTVNRHQPKYVGTIKGVTITGDSYSEVFEKARSVGDGPLITIAGNELHVGII